MLKTQKAYNDQSRLLTSYWITGHQNGSIVECIFNRLASPCLDWLVILVMQNTRSGINTALVRPRHTST